MSFLQLLAAFVACTGYGLAEGRLVERRERVLAGLVAAVGALLFVVDAPAWPLAVVDLAIAVAALGVFVALVLTLCAVLGLRGGATAVPTAPLPIDVDAPATDPATHRGAARRGALHSP